MADGADRDHAGRCESGRSQDADVEAGDGQQVREAGVGERAAGRRIEAAALGQQDGDGGVLLEISDEPMPWFVWCGDEHILGMCFIEHEMTEAVVIDVSKAIAGLGEEGTAK